MSEGKEKGESTKVTGTSKSEVPQRTEVSKITGVYHLKPAKTTWLANADPKHDGAVMFSRTFASLCPDVDYSTRLIKTGLTPELEVELETAMNLTKGTLSPYNKAYWSNHNINTNVPPEGIMIDCDRSAIEKLKYCYLKASSRVANSLSEALENPLYEFVLVSAAVEAKQESNKFAVKKKAFKLLEEMTFEDQMDFLLVFKQGKYKVSKTATPDFVTEAMAKVLEEFTTEFVELIENPSFKDFVFLRKCIVAGLLRMKGTTYVTLGGDVIGNSFEEAVYNLQKTEFNNVKVSLLAKLDNK